MQETVSLQSHDLPYAWLLGDVWPSSPLPASVDIPPLAVSEFPSESHRSSALHL